MTIVKLQNPHNFEKQCKQAGVTLDLLLEAQLSLGKQTCAKFFAGDCKRGGGNVASSALIENWIYTLKFSLENPNITDSDSFQQPRNVIPNDDWKHFVKIVKTPIYEEDIEFLKKSQPKDMVDLLKSFAYTKGLKNANSIKTLKERVIQMIDRRRELFWNKEIKDKEIVVENKEENLTIMNVPTLKEKAKSLGIVTYKLNKEEIIRNITETLERQKIDSGELYRMAYEDMTTEQLKIEAKNRNMTEYVTKKKDELIKILNEFDKKEEAKLDKITLCGIEIQSREIDNYINATSLCQAGNKLFKKWNENSGTQEFLQTLSSLVRIPTNELVTYQTGSNNERSTWVHPRVAIHIAQWISPEFSVKVTGWIHSLLSKGEVSIDKPVSAFMDKTSLENEAKELESKINIAEFSNSVVIYIAYIGKGLLKIGYSSSIINREKKHLTGESHYTDWRIIGLFEVSNETMESLLHKYLSKDRAEYMKQKEIYLPKKSLKEYVENIGLWLDKNDLLMKVNKLEKKNLELENQVSKLKLEIMELRYNKEH